MDNGWWKKSLFFPLYKRGKIPSLSPLLERGEMKGGFVIADRPSAGGAIAQKVT